jgi:hypothetical protein
LERIRHLMETRKNLAHEILLRYMAEKNAGVVDHAWVVSRFAELEEDFWAWGNLISKLYGTVAGERGVTPQELELPLTDVRESFEQEDMQLLFSTYGTAMYAVQSWESALKTLLIYLDLPGDDVAVSYDEAWEPVARILTTAAGPLRKRLEEQGYRPEGVHEELETFRNRRNELAHDFFLDYARVRKAGDPEAHGAALKFLEATKLFFEEQTDKLDALSDEEVDKRGWDLNDLGDLTEEELWRIALEDEEAGGERYLHRHILALYLIANGGQRASRLRTAGGCSFDTGGHVLHGQIRFGRHGGAGQEDRERDPVRRDGGRRAAGNSTAGCSVVDPCRISGAQRSLGSGAQAFIGP